MKINYFLYSSIIIRFKAITEGRVRGLKPTPEIDLYRIWLKIIEVHTTKIII